MEKSIETIWKEGFLRSDALIAPKITDMYNKKSKHITEKFKRMQKINLIAIVVFSIVFLIITSNIGIAIIGVTWFVLLIGLVIVNKKLMNSLQKIDNKVNSYEYLKSFNNWLQDQLSINRKMAQIYYPFFFLSIVFGFWFLDDGGVALGDKLIGEVLYGFPDIYLINGIPLIVIVVIIIITAILAFFGGKIYNFDVNIVYGNVFKKLKELLTDMEELNA